MINFERHSGLIDHDLMAASSVLCVGAGGASGLCKNLARAGIGKLTLVDHDEIAEQNPATQAFGAYQVGQLKVRALADEISLINPDCKVEPFAEKIQTCIANSAVNISDYNLVLAMTDDFLVQGYLNRIACKTNTDILLAAAYYDAEAVEITGTFADTIEAGNGCHRCHTYPRYKAYAEGFQATSGAGSHIFQAEYLNAMLGNLTVSLLHERASSAMGNPKLAKNFIQSPMIISRLNPEYNAGPEEAFSDVEAEHSSFTTKHWERHLPPEFVCADCGTKQPDFRAGQ